MEASPTRRSSGAPSPASHASPARASAAEAPIELSDNAESQPTIYSNVAEAADRLLKDIMGDVSTNVFAQAAFGLEEPQADAATAGGSDSEEQALRTFLKEPSPIGSPLVAVEQPQPSPRVKGDASSGPGNTDDSTTMAEWLHRSSPKLVEQRRRRRQSAGRSLSRGLATKKRGKPEAWQRFNPAAARARALLGERTPAYRAALARHVSASAAQVAASQGTSEVVPDEAEAAAPPPRAQTAKGKSRPTGGGGGGGGGGSGLSTPRDPALAALFSHKPSSRSEARYLGQVLDGMLSAVGTTSLPQRGRCPEAEAPSVAGTETLGFPPHVAAEISVWNVILTELVRQVYIHCEERGVVLERARVRLLQLLGLADGWCRQHARARRAAERLEAVQVCLLRARLEKEVERLNTSHRRAADVVIEYERRLADLGAAEEEMVQRELALKAREAMGMLCWRLPRCSACVWVVPV